MTETQRVLLILLEKVLSVASENKIALFAIDRLAWDLVKFAKFHDETYDAFLAVSPGSFDKLVAAVEKKQISNCSIEVYQEPYHEFFQFARFIANDSLLIDLNDVHPYKETGIAITIKSTSSILEGKGFCYIAPDGQTIQVNSSIDTVNQFSINGTMIPVLANYPEYFETLVGSDWESVNYPYHINKVRFGVLSSASVSFETFLERCIDGSLSIPLIREEWASLSYFMNSSYKRCKANITKDNAMMRYISTLYQMRDMYMPHKDVLISYWEKGKVELVSRAMKPYTDAIVVYYKKEMALYFDRDIYLLAGEILELQGKISLASLKKIVTTHEEALCVAQTKN